MSSRHLLTVSLLALVGPLTGFSAPPPDRPREPLGESDSPGAYPHSGAFKANIAWHKRVGNNEIRMSWFLRGDVNIAMICKVDLTTSKVSTSREVHDWASQCTKTRELSREQTRILSKLTESLPPSAEAPELNKLVLVSVTERGRAKTYRYDRLHLPQEVVRLYDLTGAELPAHSEPKSH